MMWLKLASDPYLLCLPMAVPDPDFLISAINPVASFRVVTGIPSFFGSVCNPYLLDFPMSSGTPVISCMLPLVAVIIMPFVSGIIKGRLMPLVHAMNNSGTDKGNPGSQNKSFNGMSSGSTGIGSCG